MQGSAGPVATLGKSEEMIYMGEERDGVLKVESASGGGWVKKLPCRNT